MRTTRPAFRFFEILIVVPVLVLPLVGGSFFLSHRNAQAAPTTTINKSVPVNKSWTFKSPAYHGVNRCILFNVKGTMYYTLGVLKNGNFNWMNQRLVNPTLTVNVRAYNGGSCK